ncbi:unnamed protein product, partial [Rotaria sp. Silwood2]
DKHHQAYTTKANAALKSIITDETSNDQLKISIDIYHI